MDIRECTEALLWVSVVFFFVYARPNFATHEATSMSRRRDSRSNVAVVGTGLAGLVTAYLLQNDPKNRYHVTLFERVRTLHRRREISPVGRILSPCATADEQYSKRKFL